jgi:hypothetical protein
VWGPVRIVEVRGVFTISARNGLRIAVVRAASLSLPRL